MRRTLSALAAGLTMTGSLTLLASSAAAAPTCTVDEQKAEIVNRSFTITQADGDVLSVTRLKGNVSPGDTITAHFDVDDDCGAIEVGLASYRSAAEAFDPSQRQLLFDADATTFQPGTGYHLTILVPTTPGGDTAACPNKHKEPEFTGNGANKSGPYDSTCDGSPSMNGNGGGNAKGKPCAGCVGNADDKNPNGQYPDARRDGNNGYECDKNNGVGKGNPAHTGCVSDSWWQVDFFVGPVLQEVGGSSLYNNRLMAAANPADGAPEGSSTE